MGLIKIVDAIGLHRFQEVLVEGGGGEEHGTADGKSAEEEVWRRVGGEPARAASLIGNRCRAAG